MNREMGDRSFSDLLEAKLERGGKLADVTGQGVFEPGTHEDLEEEVGRLGDGALDRFTE